MDNNKAYLHNEEEAVKMAIEKELIIQKFYHDNIGLMKNELAKKTFKFLADQEQKHADTIIRFNKEVLKGNHPDMEKLTRDSITHAKEFLGDNIEKIKEKLAASNDELELYEVAKDRELKAYTFYNQSAKEATHENVRTLFEFLTKEEDGHYHLLANVISYMKHPDNYFMDSEQWNFEGA